MGVDGRVFVRATINLPGLRAGREAWVDPEEEYVKVCLAASYLVAVDEPERGDDNADG